MHGEEGRGKIQLLELLQTRHALLELASLDDAKIKPGFFFVFFGGFVSFGYS